MNEHVTHSDQPTLQNLLTCETSLEMTCLFTLPDVHDRHLFQLCLICTWAAQGWDCFQVASSAERKQNTTTGRNQRVDTKEILSLIYIIAPRFLNS